jgi:hypothetical protein
LVPYDKDKQGEKVIKVLGKVQKHRCIAKFNDNKSPDKKNDLQKTRGSKIKCIFPETWLI